MQEPHTLGGIGIDFPHQQTGKYSPNHRVQGNIKLYNSTLKSMFHSEAKKAKSILGPPQTNAAPLQLNKP